MMPITLIDHKEFDVKLNQGISESTEYAELLLNVLEKIYIICDNL